MTDLILCVMVNKNTVILNTCKTDSHIALILLALIDLYTIHTRFLSYYFKSFKFSFEFNLLTAIAEKIQVYVSIISIDIVVKLWVELLNLKKNLLRNPKLNQKVRTNNSFFFFVQFKCNRILFYSIECWSSKKK